MGLLSAGILTWGVLFPLHSCGTAPDLHWTFPFTSDGWSPPEPIAPSLAHENRELTYFGLISQLLKGKAEFANLLRVDELSSNLCH